MVFYLNISAGMKGGTFRILKKHCGFCQNGCIDYKVINKEENRIKSTKVRRRRKLSKDLISQLVGTAFLCVSTQMSNFISASIKHSKVSESKLELVRGTHTIYTKNINRGKTYTQMTHRTLHKKE